MSRDVLACISEVVLHTSLCSWDKDGACISEVLNGNKDVPL